MAPILFPGSSFWEAQTENRSFSRQTFDIGLTAMQCYERADNCQSKRYASSLYNGA
jgi:hypothetical protein